MRRPMAAENCNIRRRRCSIDVLCLAPLCLHGGAAKRMCVLACSLVERPTDRGANGGEGGKVPHGWGTRRIGFEKLSCMRFAQRFAQLAHLVLRVTLAQCCAVVAKRR